MKTTHMLDFCVGDAVHMDGLTDLRGIVTEISIGATGTEYQVAWWAERDQRTAWFQPHRLQAAKDQGGSAR